MWTDSGTLICKICRAVLSDRLDVSLETPIFWKPSRERGVENHQALHTLAALLVALRDLCAQECSHIPASSPSQSRLVCGRFPYQRRFRVLDQGSVGCLTRFPKRSILIV